MTRAIAPIIGTLLLVGVTVGLAALLGTVVVGVTPPEGVAFVVLEVAVDLETNEIILTNHGGATLDVGSIEVRILINGTPLEHQPPVPFFSAVGFRAGPTGPFNTAADSSWEPDESAKLRIASTNSPQLRSGALVTVELYRDGQPLAERSVRAG